MAFNLKNKSKDPISEINVTPFVDVMLVLLIVFMVTAPLLTVGVQVDLPESSADSLPEEQEPLTLSINSKGEIFIQESKVEFDNVIAKILAVSKNRTDTRIYVRGDKTINYGRVLEVMGMLSGRSTWTPTVNNGAVTIKTIKRTNITSTNGVTFISLIGSLDLFFKLKAIL